MLVDDLLPLLREEVPLDQLVAALGSLSAKERKALSRDVNDRCSFARLGYDGTTSAAMLAILGCVNGLRQIANELRWMELESAAVPAAVQVLRDRQPAWLPDLPAALLNSGWGHGHWLFVRALVREGLVEQPEMPEYAMGMISALPLSRRVDGGDGGDHLSILAALRADPSLLNDEIWRMLATEGAGKQLANTDNWLGRDYTWRPNPRDTTDVKRPERTWRSVLVELSAKGMLDRSRLLDQTLAAFLRDWPPSDLGWFVGMHDALSPTLDEGAVRQGTYARLLGVEYGPPVSLAQQQFAKLLKANRLDAATFLAASRAPLLRADKGPVVAHLKLLKEVASQNAATRQEVAALVVLALEHDRVDVSERASALLAELVPDQNIRDELLASHGSRTAPTEVSIIAAHQPGTVALPTPPDVRPVADANELADLFRALIEEADDPIAVERVLEGVARLASERPTYGAPVLTRRAKDLLPTYFMGPWSGEELRADLCALILVWLTGASPGRGHQGRFPGLNYQRYSRDRPPSPDWSLGSLVSLRIHEVARAVAAGGSSMISLPSTTDGAISPHALSDRLRQIPRTSKPWPLDVGLAALRVPPMAYSEVVVPAAHRTGRLMQRQLERLQVYAPTWVRVSASDTRCGADPYSPAVSWLDKTSVAGSTSDAVAAVLDRTDPLRRLSQEADDGEFASRFEQVAGLWPLFLPHHPDLLGAHVHARLTRGLTKNRAATEPLLAALGRSGYRTGPVICSALVLGLAAKNGSERTAAVDAIVDLARGGWLDGTELGRQAAELMKQDLVVGQRIAQGLVDVTRADAVARVGVLDALVALMLILPGRRDAHQFIELTAELAKEQRREIELPAEFERLARGGSSSVLAAACRRVPMRTQTGIPALKS